jgi:hypothetical protein
LNKEKLKKLFDKWLELQEQQDAISKEMDRASKE